MRWPVAAAAAAAAGALVWVAVRRRRAAARAALLARWAAEQVALRDGRLSTADAPEVAAMAASLRARDGVTWRVAGLDVSYRKGDVETAVASLVVVELPSLRRVYGAHERVALEGPYVPGFLAFREVAHFARLLARVPAAARPALVFVDGNGVLHPRGFGSASHVGVVAGIPSIGIGKTLMRVDGLDERAARAECAASLGAIGDSLPLVGASGRTWGAALRSSSPTTGGAGFRPVFVSIGHGVCLDTAVFLASAASKHRVPEPIRLADLEGRKAVNAPPPTP